MSDKKRARQFLPFDGLAGYGSLIREAGREKEKKRPLSEDRAAMLDSMAGNLRKENYCKSPSMTETATAPSWEPWKWWTASDAASAWKGKRLTLKIYGK